MRFLFSYLNFLLRMMLKNLTFSNRQPAGNLSSPAKTGTLQTRSVTAAHLATDTPVRTNGTDSSKYITTLGDRNWTLLIFNITFISLAHSWTEHGIGDRLETRPPPPPHGTSASSTTYNAQNVGNLLFMAGLLESSINNSFIHSFTTVSVSIDSNPFCFQVTWEKQLVLWWT